MLPCLLPTCCFHIMAVTLLIRLHQRVLVYFIYRPLQVPLQTQELYGSSRRNPQSSSPRAPQIWALLSAPSSPLVQQLFLLFRAPMPSWQPFPVVICMPAVLCSSTNTVQNTSFPTKCLHRANLQYNYFLMSITEALKDEYKSYPRVLWHYIRCEGI